MIGVRIDTDVLDALFAPFDRTGAPGYAVGIATPGHAPYRRGFGSANIELPVALSPTMRMRIGSTTKHFTALAVLLLAERGRLSLDDSPRRYLGDLPEWAEAITIRQLLAHTSGMRDSLDLILHSSGPGRPASADFQLQYLRGLDSVNCAPGETWNYNNGGYVVATAIIEELGQRPFGEFLRREVFEPIGMNDTLVRALDTDLLPNSATLHVPTPDGGFTRGVFGTAIGGEGGIVSTVDDMLRWLGHMRRPHVGSTASWAELSRPMTSHGYALGLFNTRKRGVDLWHHAGAVVGGSCQMVRVVDPALDVILISNGRPSIEGYALVDRILDACMPDLDPLPAAAAAGPRINGLFHSPKSGRVLELVETPEGQFVRMGAMDLPLSDDGGGRFHLDFAVSDMRLDVLSGCAALAVQEFGHNDELRRVEWSEAPGGTPLAGVYRNDAALLVAEIASGEDAAAMHLTGPLGNLSYRLEAVGPELWRATAEGAFPLIVFLEVRHGRILLTTGRTVRLELVLTR